MLNAKRTHQVFMASILLKGGMAALECIAGAVLFFMSTEHIQHLIMTATERELIDDPNGIIATSIMGFVVHFTSSTRYFLAVYFLAHGLAKLAIVLGLFSGRLWSFPLGIAAMGFFVIYQLHRYTYTHSLALIAISVLDIFIIFMIWREYQVARFKLP